ncbi:endonuclease domain-containing protein [Novosphingobium sp. Fuku2-ISO-50]|uniref:endonuclease domain-containing protein n=1 Tax=Novosphingobium sp. Fuku2-ISO-50 TaxID=1739114 RepID=UPI00350EEE7B
MSAQPNPPRTGEGDHAQRGGGVSPTALRPVVGRARSLRKTMTLPEVLLWQQLRLRPKGLKFRRQHPIGPYVVDFCCLAVRLVVEIDGFAHDVGARASRDAVRTRFFEDNGYIVRRVSASHVLADAVGAAEAIAVGGARPLHHPSGGPPPRAGEDL